KELYGQQLPAKFQEIDRQWQTLQRDGWPEEAVENMARLTHQIIGTSASLGFTTVSNLARDIDGMLKETMEQNGFSADRAEAQVRKKIAQLKQACTQPGCNPDAGQ
ncbi:MAG: Hpt domain-containing protein, partial [Desulfobacterales bacterium]|nr:Hpt domain-containing protein [Desulfobacterales bacterium]